MSITAISFYWRNDTPSFVTRRSRLATAPDTPTCIVIHGGQFTGGVYPPNQFVHEIVSPLPCSPTLVRHILLIVYFFKELISFTGSLDKCHTSVFNALIETESRMSKANLVTTFSIRQNSADSVPTSNLVCIMEVAIRTTFCNAGIIYYTCNFVIDIQCPC